MVRLARNKYPEETVRLILEEALKLFMEKGYESTTIQDIINHLGGLSKGAIYHHFKSKEEIFEGVRRKIEEENSIYYDRIRDDPTKNGLEKLKTMIQSAYTNPNNDAVMSMAAAITSDPKFFTNHITDIYELVAPCYLEPIIRQGIQDGSLQTEYPKELAEVLITLLNIWISPMIARTTPAGMRKKLEFLELLLKGIGVDILGEDVEKITAQCVRYCELYNIQADK